MIEASFLQTSKHAEQAIEFSRTHGSWEKVIKMEGEIKNEQEMETEEGKKSCEEEKRRQKEGGD